MLKHPNYTHVVPPMTKLLLVAAIIFSIGSAVLGFLNRGTLAEAREERDAAGSQLANIRQQLEALQKDAEEKKQQLADLSSEKDTLAANLGEAQNELGTAKQELAAAQEKAAALETELSQASGDADAKDMRIAELEQQLTDAASASAPATPEAAGLAEITAERDEAKLNLASAQDTISGLQAQIAELRRKEGARGTAQMRQGLQGTILAVNQAWNFVVLSLGDRQGVVPNAEMLVQRGGQLLGRIRVTSVEPSTSIADILVRTVPRGLSVMPGDTVIYQAQRD
jgi:cell shape-determining protein MreC